ncbi:MAG: MOSC domain-containing protein, partial [Actinomycetota bacterium]
VTTSSLAYLKLLYPEGSVDERRFRPNILVDSGSEAAELEQGWVGAEIAIGDAVVRIVKSCSRCVMTTHAQRDLPQDKGILKTLARRTGNAMGVLAEVVRPAAVQVGDPVAPARMPG